MIAWPLSRLDSPQEHGRVCETRAGAECVSVCLFFPPARLGCCLFLDVKGGANPSSAAVHLEGVAAGLGFGADHFDRWLVSLFVSPLLLYSELHDVLPTGNYFN